MKKILAPLFLILCLCSCVSYSLTPEGEKVRTLTGDPSGNCKELGAVTAGGNATYSKYGLRNKTAELGGNVLRLEQQANSWASGTAFKCEE